MKHTLRFFFLLAFLVIGSQTTFSQETKPTDKPAPPKPTTPTTPATLTPAATPDFVGKWDIELDYQGNILKAVLTINKEENKFKGTLNSDVGEGSISEATVKENTIEGIIKFNLYGQVTDIQLKGKIEDGKMKGTMATAGIGELPFTGTKQKQ